VWIVAAWGPADPVLPAAIQSTACAQEKEYRGNASPQWRQVIHIGNWTSNVNMLPFRHSRRSSQSTAYPPRPDEPV
jgi:hypothetical protein